MNMCFNLPLQIPLAARLANNPHTFQQNYTNKENSLFRDAHRKVGMMLQHQ